MAFSKSASTSLLFEESVKSTRDGLLFNLFELDVGEFGGWIGAVKPALETGVDVTGCGVFRRVLSPVRSINYNNHQ